MYLKELDTQEQSSFPISKWEEIIKTRAEKNTKCHLSIVGT